MMPLDNDGAMVTIVYAYLFCGCNPCNLCPAALPTFDPSAEDSPFGAVPNDQVSVFADNRCSSPKVETKDQGFGWGESGFATLFCSWYHLTGSVSRWAILAF